MPLSKIRYQDNSLPKERVSQIFAYQWPSFLTPRFRLSGVISQYYHGWLPYVKGITKSRSSSPNYDVFSTFLWTLFLLGTNFIISDGYVTHLKEGIWMFQGQSEPTRTTTPVSQFQGPELGFPHSLTDTSSPPSQPPVSLWSVRGWILR
jgi:hypothetical protein